MGFGFGLGLNVSVNVRLYLFWDWALDWIVRKVGLKVINSGWTLGFREGLIGLKEMAARSTFGTG